MRSRTGYVEFAQVTIRSEEQTEELQLATYQETAAAILRVLADSNLEDELADEGSWTCEIELLDEYFDEDEQVSNVTTPKKH
jgi:hypothetical protein